MPVRALVVGAGNAGKAHADALAELGIEGRGPLSGVATAADPAPLRDPSIAIVHVATTNDLHAPLATAALRAGKHVVCEKPLATTAKEAEALAHLARESGMRTTLCYTYRFLPLIVELRERVRSGDFGPLHLARGTFLQDWLLLATDGDWRVDPGRGGGSRTVADIGVHWLDLVEFISGQPAQAVAAQVGFLHGRRTEDHASLLVDFGAGFQGVCVVSQAAAGHPNELELSLDGTNGSVTWRNTAPDELWLGLRDTPPAVIGRSSARDALARDLARGRGGVNEGRRNLIAAFYASVEGITSAVPLPTFDDGARHARFAAAALESARTRQWIDVAGRHANVVASGSP